MSSESVSPSLTISPEHLAAGPSATLRGGGSRAVALPEGSERLTAGFTLERTIGTGGTAIVRLARQHSLDREVAVKAPLLGAVSLDAVSRVLQEAWVTGLLEHPGVVPVHDVVVDDAGCPHIIMRRIEGWTWAELLDDAEAVAVRFGVRDVLEWHLRLLMSVAATVHHAHERGVLHRDLKPDNVMIGPSGEGYVLDWGIAVALDERAASRVSRASELDQLAGTPRYMAPEMADLSLGTQDVRTDVYLLGGLLYAILTGDGPHRGDDTLRVLAAIPLFVPSFPEHVPGRLAELCASALALDPAERPASAEAFRREIQTFLDDRIAEARVRWALDDGNAGAAWHALAVVKSPGAALVAEVDAARAAVDRAAAEARRLAADHDPAAGVRTRSFVSGIFGLLITVLPIAWWGAGEPASLAGLFAVNAMVALCALGLWWWARDSLGKSALNRAVIRVATASPCFQMALAAAAPALALSVSDVVTISMLLASALCLGLAATVAPWLGFGSLGYLLMFALAVAAPNSALPLLGVGNGVLLLVATVVWLPGAFQNWMRYRRERGRPAL